MSVEKSMIFYGGIGDNTRERFSMDVGVLPVRYLGFPLLTKRMGKNDYQPLIEKTTPNFMF